MQKIILLVVSFGMNYLFAQNTFPVPSGSVGIGTLSPTKPLDVRGDVYVAGSMYLDLGDIILSRETSPYGYLVRPNSAGFKKLQFAVVGGGPLEDFTVNSDRSYFTGNVGIGIYNPSSKLQVAGSRISLVNSGEARFHLFNSGGVTEWMTGQKSVALHNYTISAANNGNEADMFSITPTGDVGVGTITPSAKFNVLSSANSIASFAGTGTINNWIEVRNNSGVMNMGMGESTKHGYIWTNTGSMFIGSDGAPTLFVKGMSNGSVGIGVTDPGDYKLAVNGTIGSRKIKVTQTGWPDYVFEKEYALPTLAEVECFIQYNKHLPGIASAKEIEKNGLDLGDNQAALLKKIEELTLYVIGLEKENAGQLKRIKKLETDNAMLLSLQDEIKEIKKIIQLKNPK